MEKLEFHRYASIFPMVDTRSKEFIALCDSLLKDGNKIPILLYQGQILDGRTRYMAKQEMPAIELLPYETFTGDDQQALAVALALNNERRNLNPSQRALSAWYYARARVDLTPAAKQDQEAMKVFRANEKYIKIVAKLMKEERSNPNVKHLLHGIESGEASCKDALDIFNLVKEKDWVSASVDEGQRKDFIKEGREYKREENKRVKNAQDAGMVREKSNEAIARGEGLLYGVVLIDPPAEMTADDIRAIDVPVVADSMVFLWSTPCQLADRIEILTGWGFTFNIAYVNYLNDIEDADLLLLGVKGNGVTIDKPMVIAKSTTSKERHPLVFKQGITAMFPQMPKFDMFGSAKNTKAWMHGIEYKAETKPKPEGKGNRSNRRSKQSTNSGRKMDIDDAVTGPPDDVEPNIQSSTGETIQ